MIEKLFPDIYIENIFLLPTDKFKKMGIRALVFDIDNTVAPFDQAEADDDILKFLEKLKKDGFRLCFLSNNSKKRVEKFNEKIGASHRFIKRESPALKSLKALCSIWALPLKKQPL